MPLNSTGRWSKEKEDEVGLTGLIDAGHVDFDSTTYYGKAWDGVEVTLCSIYDEYEAVKKYLTEHPHPKDW